MKEPYRKGDSESILASSLAGDIARYYLKRRQRYWWAGLLSFEKPMEQDADSIPSGGRQDDNHVNREWIVRSCVVLACMEAGSWCNGAWLMRWDNSLFGKHSHSYRSFIWDAQTREPFL
jgi:hypothetical protein